MSKIRRMIYLTKRQVDFIAKLAEESEINHSEALRRIIDEKIEASK